MTDLERSLARFRGILEKRYQNDHDAGYTYIDLKTATLYPLTPQQEVIIRKISYTRSEK
jgi:hypothetical protein